MSILELYALQHSLVTVSDGIACAIIRRQRPTVEGPEDAAPATDQTRRP